MLLEFRVRNYRSIKEEQCLSMEKTALKSKFEYLNTSVHTDIPRYGSVLQAAVVYGANASGKSNLVRAMFDFVNFTIDSATSNLKQKTDFKPFLFETQSSQEPSFFEILFFWKGVQYRYGIKANQEIVLKEWLYRTEKREVLLIERNINKKPQLKKEFSKEKFSVRDNVAYLSEAGQRGLPYALEILNWFTYTKIFPSSFISFASQGLEHIAGEFLINPKTQAKLLTFIQTLDVGIQSIQVKEIEDSLGFYANNITYKIKSKHQVFNSNGDIVGLQNLSFEDESSGTQRLFVFTSMIIGALLVGTPIVIDEFDSQLHPNMAKALIQLFQSKTTNPNGAQLIITTHDVTLLKSNIFRRDQIWFVEKDEQGATGLYSLSDYSVRNDASFDKDYLEGKYGAVPHLEKLRQTVITLLKKEE